MIKFFANENVPMASVNYLQNRGYDITSVNEVAQGISDESVIEHADKEQRTIITFDRDYGELLFRHGKRPKGGVVYFRWNVFQPEEPGKFIESLIKGNKIVLDSRLTVISNDYVRQRKYEI